MPLGLQRLKKSAYIRNIATLLSGKMGAALVSFVLVPVVARLFSPEDYGVAAVFVAAVVVLGPLSTLCYELAIVLPEKNSDAVSLFHAVIFTLLGAVIVVLLMIGGIESLSLRNTTFEALGYWIWVLPLFVVIVGVNNALESLMVRHKGFSVIAKAGVLRALAIPSSRIGLGYVFGSSLWALLIGYLVGILCRFGVLWKNLGRDFRHSLVSLSAQNARVIAGEYKDFPLFNTPARFVRQLSENIPVLLFGYFYAPEVVGFYAMANRVVQLPAEALINAVRKVYLQKTAELRTNGQSINRIMLQTTLGLAILGIIPFGLLYLYGQSIVVLLMGEAWTVAGSYAEIVAPWFFTMWVTMPSSALYIVLRRQRIWLRIQIVVMLVRLAVFLFSQYYLATPEEVLVGFVIASAVMNIMIILYSSVTFWGVDKEKSGAGNG